jgi:predicted RNase H-like HicB family nuclease
MLTYAIFKKSETGYDVEFPEFPGCLTSGSHPVVLVRVN